MRIAASSLVLWALVGVGDGHLFLSLMADGGIYKLKPITGAKSTEIDMPH
jgi:hypothetical protein